MTDAIKIKKLYNSLDTPDCQVSLTVSETDDRIARNETDDAR